LKNSNDVKLDKLQIFYQTKKTHMQQKKMIKSKRLHLKNLRKNNEQSKIKNCIINTALLKAK